MNKARRKSLQDIADRISELQLLLSAVADEERDTADNMPENLQSSEKVEQMNENADDMESAASDLEDIYNTLQDIISR